MAKQWQLEWIAWQIKTCPREKLWYWLKMQERALTDGKCVVRCTTGGTMVNYKIIGDERERELLGHVRQTRQTAEMPDVRDPDSHLDLPCGQLKVAGKNFDFAWWDEEVLLELDGGQRVQGGGRHNSDADRWKTLAAQAAGWTVLHVSYTMLKRDPVRVMRMLAEVLALSYA